MRGKIGLVLVICTLIFLLAGCGGGGGPTPPSTPKNLTASRNWAGTADNLYQVVQLSWDPVAGATSYNVYREGTTKPINSQPINQTTYTDTIAADDLLSKEITYYVTAVGPGGESGPSNKVGTSPPSINAPQNLTADRHWVGSGGNVSQETVLNWGHWRNRQVATSYKIYRNGSLIGTTTGTTYTDPVPQDLWSQTITYKVATYIQGYEESAAEIPTSQPQLLAPQNLSADRHWAGSSPNYYQETKLTWNVVTGATAYNVYMQAEGQSIVKIGDIIKDTSFTHQIPSDLWTSNIDYFVSAVNETANLEGDKASVHTDANQVGPPPNPLSKGRKR
jgi:fibronectin type 3 domain-containing protein